MEAGTDETGQVSVVSASRVGAFYEKVNKESVETPAERSRGAGKAGILGACQEGKVPTFTFFFFFFWDPTFSK